MVRKTVEQRNKELAKEGKKLHIYGMKIRAFLTPKQEEQVHKTIGCARFTFNFYLKERIEVYNQTKETLKPNEFKTSFVQLKDHSMFNWLKEVDKFALECAIENVENAYDRFFKGLGKFPKFKKKHSSEQKYSTKFTNNNIELDTENQLVKLPKIGWVKIKLSKKQRKLFQQKGFTSNIKGATITRHSSGHWYISLKVEEIVPLKQKPSVSSIKDEEISAGDLGLTHFLIDDKGNKIENPKYYQKSLKKLAKLQRQLKNKVLGSSNYKKLQKKIAKLHLKIKNMRHDFLHQVSRKIINENQVIILEDLNVKGMIRNRKLAKSIQDVGWGLFKTFVSYKAEWDYKHVVFIDQFFPSSKNCNGCKEKNTLLSLSERIWVCPKCGTEHDRDVNAAKNIKEEGLRLLKLKEAV